MENYIDDLEFTSEIIDSIQNEKLSENSVLLYKRIVDNMIKHRNYNKYPDDVKMDMQNTAYYFFLKYWKNFSYIKENLKKTLYKENINYNKLSFNLYIHEYKKNNINNLLIFLIKLNDIIKIKNNNKEEIELSDITEKIETYNLSLNNIDKLLFKNISILNQITSEIDIINNCLIKNLDKILKNKRGCYSYFTKTCERAYYQEIKRYYKNNEDFDIIYNELVQDFDYRHNIDEDYL